MPGAAWDPALVTFPSVSGQQVLQLESSNDGSSARQTEMYHQRKFFEGTYGARVYFTDAPVRGVDGDHVVQTFFTITPLNAPMDPDYGELDYQERVDWVYFAENEVVSPAAVTSRSAATARCRRHASGQPMIGVVLPNGVPSTVPHHREGGG